MMDDPNQESKLLDLSRVMPSLRGRRLSALASRLEAALRLDRINTIHRATEAENVQGPDYFRSCLDHLGVRFEVEDIDLLRVPSHGPVVVVSNHPFGGVDALILSEVLTRLRPDSRMLGNHLLHHIPKTRPWVIPVDPFGGERAAAQNLGAMRAALRHLREGGLLVTFPSGTVSHLQPKKARITDPDWSAHVAALIRKSEATVVPIYFSGWNSLFFQLAGLVHPLLRTALLPRESVEKKGRTLRLHIGKAIPWSKLKAMEDDEKRIRFLRVSTYVLRNRQAGESAGRANEREARPMESLAAEIPAAELCAEIEALPADSLLLEQGDNAVYIAPSQSIPRLLEEIGRLRELTFREVGEGTGKARDLDAFDGHYLHLFLWNRKAHELVGAYRVGRTDEVLRAHGPRGLYTATLFKFKPGFLERLGPAIELGRSFIVSKYQMKHNSLSLLWKGVSHYIVRYPRYKIVFGPVSISQEYNKLSRNLLVQFMKEKLRHPRLSHFVKPSNPFRGISLMGVTKEEVSDSVGSIDDVSALISEIEEDGKGIPVLLKQYLRMNSLLLSFNLDKEFSNVLDGLMMADLTETDPKLLGRYMTPAGLESFLEYHRRERAREEGIAAAS